MSFSTSTSPKSKHASRGSRLSRMFPWVNLTVACVPEKHRAAFNLRSFLHEIVFILLFIEGHNVFLHFDIVLVKAGLALEPLITTVSSVDLTVARVPEKHRAAFNLRSFLHESVFTSTSFNLRSFLHERVFILLFIESHDVLLHYNIAQVKTRFTREPTNVSLVNLTLACVPEKHRAAFNLRSFLQKTTMTFSTLTSPKSKHASRENHLSQMFLW